MNETRLDFLRHLIATPSPSGFEQPAQQLIREDLAPICDDVRTDVHGNVIAALNPSGTPRVMLTAHCDELGFIIRHINEEGFLYFSPIGGFDPSTLAGSRVLVHAPSGPLLGVIGRPAVHTISKDDRGKAPDLAELWIDIGVADKAEAQKLVPLGTVATRAAELERLRNDLVVSRALDNKSGIFTLIETMHALHARRNELKAGVFFASAVQEEVGLRGARTAAFSIDPLIAVAVDVTFTADHPGTSKRDLGDIKLNGGPVLTIGGHVNPRVYQLLVQTAEAAGLAWQIDVQASHTGTDADMIQVTRAGVATAVVSIPCRYMHTGSETVSLKDMAEISDLLTRFVLALDAHTNVIP
ncbi:M42 family metallopeptidase [Tengunoibacter tsumagoiensis]|uniref:Endoglucanase n=1 Tax=Tengunoibacter tsumagoiensis TaxID=2014871 RepID=A0A401ZWZ2_9CHLR|nr:M42 family metallopeptidase [Tengunoibacter tsumagoiensis]GCE11310.1 endoglucanase [Tengunoibacter tsumagoiensis]